MESQITSDGTVDVSSAVKRALKLFPGSLGESSIPPELMVVVERGEGSAIWDTQGRRHVDFTMGWGSVLLGHAFPSVTEAVIRRAPLGVNFSHINEPAIQLAELIVQAVPCAEKVRFCSSGTEATAYAIAVARAFTQRPKILKFEGAYHGAHDFGTLSLYARQLRNFPSAEPMSAATTENNSVDVLVAPLMIPKP